MVVPAQDRAERIQYGRGGRLGIVERQHQVHRMLAERQLVIGGFARQHAVVHADRRRTPRRLSALVHGVTIPIPRFDQRREMPLPFRTGGLCAFLDDSGQ